MTTQYTPEKLAQARLTVLADLGRGESAEQVASYLVKDGWNEAEALEFVHAIKAAEEAPPEEDTVANVVDPQEARHRQLLAMRKVATHNMKVGGAWFVGGALITGLSYLAAPASRDGRYIITWGALVYGGWRFLVGFKFYRKSFNQ